MSELLFIRANNKLGFRRAGEFFSSQGKTIDPADFTNSQLQQFKAEPMLLVTAKAAAGDPPDGIIEGIVAAMGVIDPNKKPNVKDLVKVIGKDITATQRDTAWAVYQQRFAAG